MQAPPCRTRLRTAGTTALTDPRVVWAIAAVLAFRTVVFNLSGLPRPDGLSYLAAGHTWLTNPGHLYDAVAAHIAQTHQEPTEGLIAPPTAAVVAALFSLLPAPAGLVAWTLADCIAIVAALWVLDRMLALSGAVRAWFWVTAMYFPPLFAETQASQTTGFIVALGCVAIAANRSRPALAGVLAAMGVGMKLYPAAWILGVTPRRMPRYLMGFVTGTAAVSALSFGPMGIGAPLSYLSTVLLPVLGTPLPDCQVVSVSTFWDRLIGGVAYPTIENSRVVFLRTPWGAPWLATALADITVVAIIVAAIVGACRSGWQPVYSMALAIALGGLIPGELRTYQVLPMLPLVLVVLVAALRGRRLGIVALLAVGLLAIADQPCSLIFPNIWTIALLWLFGVCVGAARLIADTIGDQKSPRPQ